MNLLFAINQKFTGLLCTCIRSILQNGGADHYDAYILHSDLTSAEETQISQAAGDVVTCHFLPMEEATFAGFPESDRYPKQIYYRLAAPLLLPKELDRILYLDVDLVVINSLEELYRMNFEGNYACSHVREFLTKFNQLRLGVEEDVPYINTGVMLLNLPLLRDHLTMEQLRETAQKKMHTFMLPDQDLLTILHGEHIKLVDTMRFNLSDRMLSIHNANPQNPPLNLGWVRKTPSSSTTTAKTNPGIPTIPASSTPSIRNSPPHAPCRAACPQAAGNAAASQRRQIFRGLLQNTKNVQQNP